MNKFIAGIFFLILSLWLKSQDSIFVHSNEILLVRVLEISSSEVTYKNFYNPDGIIRKLAYKQVDRIVYENGMTESRFLMKEKTTGATKQSQLFVVEGKHIALNNIDITHKAAFKIMLLNDPQTNSDELNGALVDADSKRNGQIAFNILAPASFIGGIYFARQHRYNDPTEKLKARVYFISGLSICIVSVITAQIYKAIKNQHIRRATLLYNADLL
ncbi:MAG: hypothetical protein V4565_01995 [Bacteroidota bacterium]